MVATFIVLIKAWTPSPSSQCTEQNMSLYLAKSSCSFQRHYNCTWIQKAYSILNSMVRTVVGMKGQSPRTGASQWASSAVTSDSASADGGAVLTPGIAHSPQSFLFIATNCKMHFPETGCVILLPLSSLFHLWTGTEDKVPAHTCANTIKMFSIKQSTYLSKTTSLKDCLY